MAGLALVDPADGIAGWLVAYEASVGLVLALFGAVTALRPDRLDWAPEGPVGLPALVLLALAGTGIGRSSVVA